jgi:hypothetical protein
VDVIVAPSPNGLGRFRGLVAAHPDVWQGRVLDVGCRDGGLRASLDGRPTRYLGLDVAPPADLVADLDRGLPLPDASFDTVVALDVLEHTDRLHRAFDELCRVSRRWVLLTLPNAYEVRLRVRFATGRPLGAKYGLPLEPPRDRHRWLFSLDDARAFVPGAAAAAGFATVSERVLVGPRRARLGALARRFPNLLAPTYVALLRRTRDAG